MLLHSTRRSPISRQGSMAGEGPSGLPVEAFPIAQYQARGQDGVPLWRLKPVKQSVQRLPRQWVDSAAGQAVRDVSTNILESSNALAAVLADVHKFRARGASLVKSWIDERGEESSGADVAGSTSTPALQPFDSLRHSLPTPAQVIRDTMLTVLKHGWLQDRVREAVRPGSGDRRASSRF